MQLLTEKPKGPLKGFRALNPCKEWDESHARENASPALRSPGAAASLLSSTPTH